MATATRGRFRKRPARPPGRVLTAAATRINLQDTTEIARQMRLRQGWQFQAWAYRDQIGELRYALNFLANCAARMKVFPAAYPMDGESDNPVALKDLGETVPESVITACGQAMSDLGNGRRALSEIMRSLSTNMSVAGEGWLLGMEDQATGQTAYSIRSISEIVIKENKYYLSEIPTESQGVIGQVELDLEETVLSRIWTPHPQYPLLADSALRALGPDCESLLIMRRMIRATGRSRLAGAGILLVPDELEIVGNNDNDDPEAQDFLGDLTETMMEPIAEEGVASSVVPITIRGPAEYLAAVRHLSLASEFGEQDQKVRGELVGNLATGLDLPKEVMTGVADLNHWTSWQVDDNTFRHHVEPHVIICCDGLTGAYLRPYLKATPCHRMGSCPRARTPDPAHDPCRRSRRRHRLRLRRPPCGSPADNRHRSRPASDDAACRR